MEEPLKTPDKGYGSSCLTQTTSIKTNAFFVDSFETTCLPGQLQQGTVFVPLQKLVSSMRRVFPRLHCKGQLQSVGQKDKLIFQFKSMAAISANVRRLGGLPTALSAHFGLCLPQLEPA